MFAGSTGARTESKHRHSVWTGKTGNSEDTGTRRLEKPLLAEQRRQGPTASTRHQSEGSSGRGCPTAQRGTPLRYGDESVAMDLDCLLGEVLTLSSVMSGSSSASPLGELWALGSTAAGSTGS